MTRKPDSGHLLNVPYNEQTSTGSSYLQLYPIRGDKASPATILFRR